MPKPLDKPRRQPYNAHMPRKARIPNLRATLNALTIRAFGGCPHSAAALANYRARGATTTPPAPQVRVERIP